MIGPCVVAASQVAVDDYDRDWIVEHYPATKGGAHDAVVVFLHGLVRPGAVYHLVKQNQARSFASFAPPIVTLIHSFMFGVAGGVRR